MNNTIKDINNRFKRGYTMTIYGNRDNLYQQMSDDIEFMIGIVENITHLESYNPLDILSLILKTTPEKILSKSRESNLVFARMILYNYHKYKIEGNVKSDKEIGVIFGKTGNSVRCALRNFNNLIETSKYHLAKFNEFKRMMG